MYILGELQLVEMAISIDFSKILTNFLGKQPNNSDQGAIIRKPIVSPVAKLKINVVLGKFILEFAVILVKQYRDKQWQQY